MITVDEQEYDRFLFDVADLLQIFCENYVETDEDVTLTDRIFDYLIKHKKP